MATRIISAHLPRNVVKEIDADVDKGLSREWFTGEEWQRIVDAQALWSRHPHGHDLRAFSRAQRDELRAAGRLLLNVRREHE